MALVFIPMVVAHMHPLGNSETKQQNHWPRARLVASSLSETDLNAARRDPRGPWFGPLASSKGSELWALVLKVFWNGAIYWAL